MNNYFHVSDFHKLYSFSDSYTAEDWSSHHAYPSISVHYAAHPYQTDPKMDYSDFTFGKYATTLFLALEECEVGDFVAVCVAARFVLDFKKLSEDEWEVSKRDLDHFYTNMQSGTTMVGPGLSVSRFVEALLHRVTNELNAWHFSLAVR